MRINFGTADFIEMVGSGENGALTEQEFELFRNTVEKFFIERKEKLDIEKSKIIRENIKEISTRCSDVVRNICCATATTSLDHNNQSKMIDYMVNTYYDPALDHLDLTGPKDEEQPKKKE